MPVNLAQDRPNLCWGRFNNIGVDSIIFYKLWYYSINNFYHHIPFASIYALYLRCNYTNVFNIFGTSKILDALHLGQNKCINLSFHLSLCAYNKQDKLRPVLRAELVFLWLAT